MLRSTTGEQRRFSRTQFQSEVSTELLVNGRVFPGEIIDYSPGGFQIRSHKKLQGMGNSGQAVELTAGSERYFGNIRYSRDTKTEQVIGVGLQIPEFSDSEVLFSNVDAGWDLIADTEVIATLFSDLAFKGPEVKLELRQISGRSSAFLLKVDKDVLRLESLETKLGHISVGKIYVSFEIFQTCHAFESRVREIQGNRFAIEMPLRLARLLRRETVRILNQPPTPTLSVKLSSPLFGRSPEGLAVFDFSEHGFSLADTTGWASAPIGFTFDDVELSTSQGASLRGRGRICSHRWSSGVGATIVGVQFETATDRDRNTWHNVILAARYPGLDFEYHDEDHDRIWDLFERSDYLHLKGKEAYTHVIDLTRGAWTRLASAGTQWSKRAVIRSEDHVVGHIQMDQIYPDTWCVHHLAVDPKISKMVAKELYAVTTDVLLSEGGNHVLNFTEAAKPWNQRSYYDFVANYRFPEHNQLKALEIYDADLTKSLRLEEAKGWTVSPPDKFDRKRILRFFEIHMPELERQACGLVDADLELQSIHRSISPHGLERGREFLVARSGSRFGGVARIETGSAGVNIVGVLDIIYIHLSPELGSDAPFVHEALLKGALSRFAQLGRDHVIVALDDGRMEHYTNRGLTFVTHATRWIARRDILPRYHAFSQLLYGHLTIRKEKIRQKPGKA